MAPLLTRLCALVLTTGILGGCATVKVRTDPPDAAVEVDGEDISEQAEIRERPGFRPYQLHVSRPGYASKDVTVPRTRMVGWVKWLSLFGSLGCSTVCAAAGCACCGAACNRVLLASILGGLVGAVVGLASADSLPLNVYLINSVAPDWLTLPGMALGTALGSLPLLGLMIPLLYPHGPDEVNVVLTRNEPAAPPAVTAP